MLNRYLRHGRDSEQWMESVLLLKLLLKCMQPIKHSSQYELITSNQAALIEAVNDELYETKQDKNDIASQIATLKAHFAQMMEDYGYEVVTDGRHENSQDDPTEDSAEDAEKELQQIKQQTAIAQPCMANESLWSGASFVL